MGEHVMVLAPVPQLTVTVEQVGTRPELHLHAGGRADAIRKLVERVELETIS